MKSQYYYFVSSLPLLQFGGTPPYSCEDFLEASQRLLSASDHKIICALIKEDTSNLVTHNETIDAFLGFERRLKNEMVYLRAEELGKDPLQYLRGDIYRNIQLDEIIQRAKKESNLLEGEKIIDQARWQFLDNILVGHCYDIEFLAGYAVKVKILNRYAVMRSDRGRQIFSEYKNYDVSQEKMLEYK